VILRGTPVSPGLAVGPIHRKDYELDNASLDRIPREAVEGELNRFHTALVDARAQLADLKEKLAGKVPVDDARILDVHVAYLKDSVFHSDVENLILNERLCLEAAIAKVIGDFDRIFKLVQNETLRERAVDLRDVGIRVLRHLEKNRSTSPERPERPKDYILAAKELSIVDMFNLAGEHVLGILTEAGSLTSHAAILARSMRIPTLTAVPGLLGAVHEGDFVILDASEGLARINPDEVVRAPVPRAGVGNACTGSWRRLVGQRSAHRGRRRNPPERLVRQPPGSAGRARAGRRGDRRLPHGTDVPRRPRAADRGRAPPALPRGRERRPECP
jgi:phosphotransferase system enzyme I (PtsI)